MEVEVLAKVLSNDRLADYSPKSPQNSRLQLSSKPAQVTLQSINSDNISNDSNEGDDDEDKFEVRKPLVFTGEPTQSVNLKSSAPTCLKQDTIARSSEDRDHVTLAEHIIKYDESTGLDTSKKLKNDIESSPLSSQKLIPSDILETDESILFYWIDYIEINGILGLFGKVKDKSSGRYVSAYCRIEGILRTLYFLPRATQLKNPSQDVSMADVHGEVAKIMRDAKVTKFKAKKSSRKYAFDLPGIPQQADYLKLLYNYKGPLFPEDLKGDSFSHVFGTNTSMFEQFVLFRKIMGPCWLQLKHVDLKAAINSTWCRFEVGVSDPENVTPVTDLSESKLPEIPPMTLMSVAFRTILNKKDNKMEIVVASARVYHNLNLEDPTPPESLPSQKFTISRPLRNVFPNGYEQEARRQGILLERNETALLNAFLTKWHNADPDIIVGHDWETSNYGTLLARLREKRIANWHRIGRMKRSEWPKITGRGGFYAERSLAIGRLMCDLSNDLGRSLMAKAQSWSLTELCKLELDVVRQDMDSEKALQPWTETAKGMIDYVMHCSVDTFYQTSIALKVQIIPLSRQLTSLAGNSWAATLSGTRAQRNEYILLHEFTKNKYICPDKIWQRSKTIAADDEETEDSNAGRRKDKYKGGLVFEPQKGLYDKFILVMDFNSLYPSIIQEYNICFTTIERNASDNTSEEEVIPNLPDRDIPQGILPRIIANLVNRRRQVKSLMKAKGVSDVQRAQWDIRQQALKLTANSMYGCLGYTKSRFYARPLAVLTTFKGREALTNTKELAESLNLEVIYGDTDSVMINSNVDNHRDAIKIGQEFKKNVNERYKLLEIDIDNVFQRMLLHAKKKYAALVFYEVNGKLETKIEVKGLDMRRREYCVLAKEASQYCLDQILSGEQADLVVEIIHEFLRDFARKMMSGKFPKHKFIILNRLGKEPSAYPNAKSMPHVQVALKRQAKGEIIRPGDVMQYIITGASCDNRHVAERAYPAIDVTKPGAELEIDYEYYLANQILPPLERLCAPIEGTDRTRIAECLGLDPSKYRVHELHDLTGSQVSRFEANISDEDRFADSVPLVLKCTNCGKQTHFEGITAGDTVVSADGLHCVCGLLYKSMTVNAQICSQIQAYIARYYQAWLVCDDTQCATRTQQCGVYGRRCLTGTCRGEMRFEYSDKMLYLQLLYLETIFDVDRAKMVAQGKDKERILAIAEQNRLRFDVSKSLVTGFLKKCGRRYVDMGGIFSFC